MFQNKKQNASFLKELRIRNSATCKKMKGYMIKQYRVNVTHQCSKCMRVSQKERNRIMCLMKTQVESQDFDNKITMKLEENINKETNPNKMPKRDMSDMSTTTKHHAKSRKFTMTWI